MTVFITPPPYLNFGPLLCNARFRAHSQGLSETQARVSLVLALVTVAELAMCLSFVEERLEVGRVQKAEGGRRFFPLRAPFVEDTGPAFRSRCIVFHRSRSHLVQIERCLREKVICTPNLFQNPLVFVAPGKLRWHGIARCESFRRRKNFSSRGCLCPGFPSKKISAHSTQAAGRDRAAAQGPPAGEEGGGKSGGVGERPGRHRGARSCCW